MQDLLLLSCAEQETRTDAVGQGVKSAMISSGLRAAIVHSLEYGLFRRFLSVLGQGGHLPCSREDASGKPKLPPDSLRRS